MVATKDARIGDVLLEVPLRCTLGDSYDGDTLPRMPPRWCQRLSWNVQLAFSLLHCRGDPDWAPFLESWPDAPEPLPKDLDTEDLEEVQDEAFEVEAESAYCWLAERYLDACEAHEAASAAEPLPTEEEFNWAMAFVWSRSLRLSAGAHGERRLLVPVLDLANHEAVPSALFAYSGAARCGPAVRLHAARALCPGDPVTITYGEHPSAHFALYYGFVPKPNPFDHVLVTLAMVLSEVPSLLIAPPQDGWDAALQTLEQTGYQTRGLPLYAAVPAQTLLQVLQAAVLLADSALQAADAKALALRALARFCASVEADFETSCEEDEALLQAAGPSEERLPEGVRLLVELRLARKELVRGLRQTLEKLIEDYGTQPAELSERLGQLQEQLEPRVYPELTLLPNGEEPLERWSTLAWDWESGSYEVPER